MSRVTREARRDLIGALLAVNPVESVSSLQGFLRTEGISVSDKTVYRDVQALRAKVAEDPSTPAVFGLTVQLLIAAAERAFADGAYQSMTLALRELKDLLHLDEVIPSAKLKAMNAGLIDMGEVADIFSQVKGQLTEGTASDD